MRDPYDHLRRAERLFLGKQHPRDPLELGIEREWRHERRQIRLLLNEHCLHGGERRLDHGIVAPVLEPVLAQHRPHGDVDCASGGVGRDDPAFEILDRADGAVREHEELVAVMAARPVLELVPHNAQILEPCVLDRQCERGKSEIAELDLVVGKCSDDRRRPLEPQRLESVGLAVVLHQLRLFGEERCPVGRGNHPARANLDRLGGGRRKGGGEGRRQPGDYQGGERAHGSSPRLRPLYFRRDTLCCATIASRAGHRSRLPPRLRPSSATDHQARSPWLTGKRRR